MNTLLKVVGGVTVALIIGVVAFAGGVAYERENLDWHPPIDETNTSLEAAVTEVAGIIGREALEPTTETSLTAGAIAGMLEALDDDYAMYFNPDHFDYFNEMTSGVFYGIGVTISSKESSLTIVSVIPGTPAEAAGLKANDVIVEIDGETRPKWDSDDAVSRIRGDEGTVVTLGIRRGDEEKLRSFDITRAKIDVPNMETELLEGNVGYIRLYQFTTPAAEDIEEAIKDLTKQGAKGFVLDLRDNPGGLLESSVDVTSLFVADGVVVRVEDREGVVDEHRVTGSVVTDAPLVVLINENSASASEIVGGALQDYGRATLVGTKSFGKGSVQQIEDLSFGGGIKLTIAHYVTPKGQIINGVGLTPDVLVEMEPELQMEKDTDTQLKRAIEVLEGEI